MTWTPLLLADPSPSLRLLVLRDLLNRPENDEEVQELKRLQPQDPRIIALSARQNKNGSWREGEGGGAILGSLRLTAQALMTLGYFGLQPNTPLVQRGAEFLFSQQLPDGSWQHATSETIKRLFGICF